MTSNPTGSILKGVLMIDVNRDHAADSVTIVRLLRSGNTQDALFILSSYANDNDGLQALVGSMAALANALLMKIDSMSAELNKTADCLVPDGNAVLAAAVQAVATFDPSKE
jgi:hypothetical protein